MYAVGIINMGKAGLTVPAGNDVLQKLRNKTRGGWKKETRIMRNNVDWIAVMPEFTQKMCEMGPGELARYCDVHAVTVIYSYED